MDDKWFKKRQKEIGVTAEDIANEMGRARSGVSHIYSGQQRMSLDWAKAFSKVLQTPLDEILRRAGVANPQEAQSLNVGFSESDAVPFVGQGHEASKTNRIALELGGGKPGIDVWTVKSDALALNGYMPGDFILVDTHKSEMCKAGDCVLAQVYNHQSGTAETILRRFEPPVLVAAGPSLNAQRVHIVDHNNVAIAGKIISSWRC